MHVCLPDELLGSQAVLIIEKFMKEHPEQLHYPARVVAFYALWQDFSCSK
jgi:Rap1a immunity proteins